MVGQTQAIYDRHVIETDIAEIVEACQHFVGADEKRISHVANSRTESQLAAIQKQFREITGTSLFEKIKGKGWSLFRMLDDGLSNFARLTLWRMMDSARQTAYFSV